MNKAVAIALAGMMLLPLGGCGSTTASDAGTSTAAASEKTAAADSSTAKAAEGAPVTIKIAWWGGDARHEYTQKLLDLYTSEHPNVTFETSPSGWDGYFDKLATQAASGSMPDIVQMDYQYISTYANNESVADLQPYIDDGTIDVSSIDENLLNTAKINNRMAGIVLSMSSLAVGYNPDVFKAAGVSEPDGTWTWEQFKEVNKKISEKTGKESVITSSGITGDVIPLRYWMRQHGQELFNADGTALAYTDDQVVTDFFTYWKDLVDENINPDPDEDAQIQTLGHDQGPVVTGDAACCIDWNNYASRVASVNDNIKITNLPLTDDGKSGLWNKPGMFFSVAETSTVKKECAEFINWFVNSDEANNIIMAERGTPVSSKVRESLIASGKMTQQMVDMFNYTDNVIALGLSTPAPDPQGISEINESIKNIGSSVFLGQTSPEDAAAQFREEVTDILSRNAK